MGRSRPQSVRKVQEPGPDGRTPAAMVRNPHGVFTEIGHSWEDERGGKVNQTLGRSFYLQEGQHTTTSAFGEQERSQVASAPHHVHLGCWWKVPQKWEVSRVSTESPPSEVS